MNERYRHFKTGIIYEVLHVGKMDPTLGKVVVYRQHDKPDGQVWVRPFDDFHATLATGGERFTLVEDNA